MRGRGILFIILLSWLPVGASAFSLSDHTHIMNQTLREFRQCYPGFFSPVQEKELWLADLSEDVNIFRKDLYYSHFYNPFKKIKMWRSDSAERVARIARDLKNSAVAQSRYRRHEALLNLGRALHQIQDMAAPPHVIPVMHGLNDGFEKYDFDGEMASGFSCADLLRLGRELPQVHYQTALATMDHLKDWKVAADEGPAFAAQALLDLVSSAFWNPSESNRFGRYGVLGNHYGQTDFTEHHLHYRVPEKVYTDFKQQQLRQAVRATLQGLVWYRGLSK